MRAKKRQINKKPVINVVKNVNNGHIIKYTYIIRSFQKHPGSLFPAVQSVEAGNFQVVYSRKKVWFTFKMLQVACMVIDHVVAIYHALIATQHQLLPVKIREMLQ
jgi:hypothetical protein